MENKDIVIIALVVLVIYLYYRQNTQPSLLGNSTEQIKNLQQEVQHYQTLYQKRVKKDLGHSQTSQETQTEYSDTLTNQDQAILEKVKEFRTLIEKTDDNSIDRGKINEIERLADQITHPSVKAIANQVITDSAYVLGHLSLLKKLQVLGDELEEKKQEINQNQQGFNEQLRKISLLFDDKAKDYKAIEFNGLYSLLEKVKAERERERESKSGWPFSRSSIQPKEKTKEVKDMQQTIQELNQKIINLQLEKAEKMEEKDRKIEELEERLGEKK